MELERRNVDDMITQERELYDYLKPIYFAPRATLTHTWRSLTRKRKQLFLSEEQAILVLRTVAYEFGEQLHAKAAL